MRIGSARRLIAACVALCFVNSAVTIASEVFEDTIERTVPLNPDGTVILQNIDGTVQLYGSDVNEVKIVAIKHALSLTRLNAIQIQVNQQPGGVEIKTSIPPAPRSILGDRSGTVDYVVRIPQHARIVSAEVPSGELYIDAMRGPALKAAVGTGRLTTHNCFCDQTLRVQSGVLALYFEWPEDRVISIDGVIEDGNVQALVPSDTSFELHARAENGKIASDFTEPERRSREGVSSIDEIIGAAPHSKLTLQAKDGNIRVSQLVW